MIDSRFLILFTLPLVLFIIGCADVKTVSPVRKNIVATVYASGEIVPQNEHWISAQKSGTLLRRNVKEGDTIKSHQLLYIIGDEAGEAKTDAAIASYQLSLLNVSDSSPILSDLKLALTGANAKFKNDSANHQRWQKLWDHGIGTKSNLENAEMQYIISRKEKDIATQRYLSRMAELNVSRKNAESQLASAKKELSDGFILSDREGIVYETIKDEGENVVLNERLLLVGDCAARIIRLNVDQQDIGKIIPGQKVLVQTDLFPDTVFEAKVSFIFPSMNKNDQTFRVEAKFDQRSPYSFIHTPVEANIVVEERKDVLVVPKEVLAGRDSIWIKENKKYRKVFVKTGISSFDYVEVVEGLNENNAVILDWYKIK